MNATFADGMKRLAKILQAVALQAAALFFLAMGNTAAAGPLEEAQTAYDSGDYAAAFLLWRPLAEQGSADAQFKLADMHMFGEGMPADAAQAVKWYLLSADQDFPNAQFALGFMYMNAIGVGKDYVQAVKWFRLCERHAGFAYFAGKNADLITGKMTPAQITEAEKLAAAWRPKAP